MLSGVDQKTTVSKPWQLAAWSSRKNRSDYWIRLHLLLVSVEIDLVIPGECVCTVHSFYSSCRFHLLCPLGLRLLERWSIRKRHTASCKTCVQLENPSYYVKCTCLFCVVLKRSHVYFLGKHARPGTKTYVAIRYLENATGFMNISSNGATWTNSNFAFVSTHWAVM
jgi:hypothetical protein